MENVLLSGEKTEVCAESHVRDGDAVFKLSMYLQEFDKQQLKYNDHYLINI